MATSADVEFAEFFDSTYAKAVRVARRITGDAQLAEDLAAEGLARAYARWPQLRRTETAEAWTLRVVVNLSIDAGRKRKVQLASVDSIDHADSIAIRMALIESLRQLPKRQRHVVALRYLADLPEREVAETLGVSQGSVKTHLHRAMRKLKIDLDAQMDLANIDGEAALGTD